MWENFQIDKKIHAFVISIWGYFFVWSIAISGGTTASVPESTYRLPITGEWLLVYEWPPYTVYIYYTHIRIEKYNILLLDDV